MVHTSPTSETELSERVVLELDERLAGVDTEGSPEPDQVTRDLQVDRAMAAAHSRMASEVISADDSTLCRECHEPRPCSTSLGLALKYAMTPGAEAAAAAAATSAATAAADAVPATGPLPLAPSHPLTRPETD